MFFKRGFILLALLTACEKAPIAPPIQFGSGVQGCLNGYADKIRDYFEGHSNSETISGVFDCYDNAIGLFAKHVRGQEAGKYQPGELQKFLETFFLNGEKIPDEFVKELVGLHGVVLGSAETELTIKALERIQEVFKILKTEALRMLPWMPLTSSHLATLSKDDFNKVVIDLGQSKTEISKIFENASSEYSAERMKGFVRAFSKVLKFTDSEADSWMARADLFLSLKNLFLATSKDKVKPTEWKSLIELAGHVEIQLIRIQALFARPDMFITDEDGIQAFEDSILSIVQILRDALKARAPETVLEYKLFDQIIDSGVIAKSGFNFPLTNDSFKKAIRFLFHRIMGPVILDTATLAAMPRGFTLDHLSRFEVRFQRWTGTQRVIVQLFKRIHQKDIDQWGPNWTLNVQGTPFHLFKFSRKELLTNLDEMLSERRILPNLPLHPGYLDDLKEMIKLPAFYVSDRPEVNIRSTMTTRDTSLYSLSTLAWIWSAYRTAFLGTCKGPECGWGRSITKKQFEELYLELRPIAVELKAFDPRYPNTSMRRFREANLFTSTANGDEDLSITEAAESAAFMFSIKFFSTETHEKVMDKCADEGAMRLKGRSLWLDPAGSRQATRGCFQKHFFNNIDEFWKRTPGLLDYYKNSGSKSEMESIFLNLANQSLPPDEARQENARGNFAFDPDDQKFVNSLDTDALNLLTFYMENLFIRFDANHNGDIDLAESKGIFKVFRSFLYSVAKSFTSDPDDLTDDKLYAIITYGLSYGKLPDVDSLIGKAEFGLWMLRENWDWEDKVHGDRLRILQILEIIQRYSKD